MTVKNVVDFWFAEDTPIRQYKVRMNPRLWDVCQDVSKTFIAPSGITNQSRYRKSDKVAFARVVLKQLGIADEQVEEPALEMAY